ncbi:MAG: lipid biosynthesis B12-binding/radical SAM protein [Desulfobacteraceae bacterium]|nr:lipid biosynthesis B12-binding/radical SAM protein [Desulfobacteraceae bacterium]
MSKILLISTNTCTSPIPVYPLGIALIAAALKKNGHATRQFDLLYNQENKNDSLGRVLLEFAPDFVGISVRNIDNVDSMATKESWYLSHLKNLVSQIKGVCQAPIIIGGPAFSIMPENILELSNADFGVVGEGEITLNRLIDDLLKNKKPPRIIYPDKIPMETPDFLSPQYDNTLVNYYMDKSGMINYQTKRGCPHGCNYCSYPLIEGHKFRKQDPEFVVENLIRLKKQFNVNKLFFTDSVFNDPRGDYLKIAELMIKKNCKMEWAAYFRPQKTQKSELELLKAAGLYAAEIGSDGACDTTLKGLNKNFLFEDILAFNEACHKTAIPCAHFFMFGGPGETPDTITQSLKNIEHLKKSVVFIFSGIRILPRTRIAAIAKAQGIIDKNDSLLQPSYYVSPLVDKKIMDAKIQAAFHRQRGRFFPPEKGEMRMKALQIFGFKGLLWDMILNIPEHKSKYFHTESSCKSQEI